MTKEEFFKRVENEYDRKADHRKKHMLRLLPKLLEMYEIEKSILDNSPLWSEQQIQGLLGSNSNSCEHLFEMYLGRVKYIKEKA